MRSVPPRNLSKGEAHRLVNAATKILIATVSRIVMILDDGFKNFILPVIGYLLDLVNA